MSNNSGGRSGSPTTSTALLFLILLILAFVTIAEAVLANTLPLALGPISTQVPGFWNLSTTALCLSTVSDLIGQFVLCHGLGRFDVRRALALNVASVAFMAAASLFLSPRAGYGYPWMMPFASVFKVVGAGAHVTTYLAIVSIRENATDGMRAALIYTTGAVIVLCQTLASAITPSLWERDSAVPYVFSILTCILASVVLVSYNHLSEEGSSRERTCTTTDPACQPLLLPTVADMNKTSTGFGIKEMYRKKWRDTPAATQDILRSLGIIFFITAIAKATRPLFATYIQHRVGVTPETAAYLWSVRTIMSLGIFAVALPLAVLLIPKHTSIPPSRVTLSTAQVSIVLLAIGAFMIGLARTKPVLMAALIINTLGVATDLSLLAFATDAITDDTADYFLLFLASLESAGTLIGIGVLYTIYQYFLYDKTVFGGLPYYICAAIFVTAGTWIWKLPNLTGGEEGMVAEPEVIAVDV